LALSAFKALQIKAFTALPTKKANIKILVNQCLIRAIGFVAGAGRSEGSGALQQKFCA
jgi:hypothetical protein